MIYHCERICVTLIWKTSPWMNSFYNSRAVLVVPAILNDLGITQELYS